jgi:hypothetical protein
MRQRISQLSIVICLQLVGCVSIPHEELSPVIETYELSDHVHFLAQSALKGRKPKTWESATARRYIKNRFEAYDLVPWPSMKGYEQPFGFGTNVIGVLPGTDPNLADEIVILAAHYDHLGKGKKGIYHGACDNASGVAALLEIAEHLSKNPNRPKRSICFASFDCEEMFTLGAFAFTCRKDFEKAKVVAVVNVDLVGRDFLDVVEGSLFVVGTELYPTLRSQILQLGKQAGIEVLPIGTDLVGPRGDHVAFETLGMPVLFFTCGIYGDYHKPTDTPEKLNYSKMQRSVNVIAETVKTLSNVEQIDKRLDQCNADMGELRTFAHIFKKIASDYETAGLNAEQGKIFQKLTTDATLLLDNLCYGTKDRQRFLQGIVENLLPSFMGTEAFRFKVKNDNDNIESMPILCMSELYAKHRESILAGYRNIVKSLLKKRPSLFGRTLLEYEDYDLTDEEISFTEAANGKYELYVFLPKLKMYFKKSSLMFWKGEFGFDLAMEMAACKGSRAELVDFCLLKWVENPKDESYGRAWDRVLRKVTDQEMDGTYDSWLNWWMSQSSYSTQEDRLYRLIKSGNTSVVSLAIHRAANVKSERIRDLICQIIKNSDGNPSIRASAIRSFNQDTDLKSLLTLVDVLDDNTQWNLQPDDAVWEKFGILTEHPCVQWCSQMSKKWYEKDYKPETLSDLTEKRLKELTKQNFGKDAKTWRKWTKANRK